MPDTSLSLLAAAREGSAEAMEEFARRYYRAVRSYIGALTHRDESRLEELTQEFFAERILGGNVLQNADPARAFRPFLKQALRNFIVEHWRRRRAEGAMIHPDDAGTWDYLLGPDFVPAEAAFHETWVRDLLAETLRRVEQLCRERGQESHFDIFVAGYIKGYRWEDIARDFEVPDGKAARNRAETVVRHVRVVLRQMVTMETGSAAATDDEIRALLALF